MTETILTKDDVDVIYVDERAASRITSISTITFQCWRARKKGGPPWRKLGGKKIVYKLDELIAWCEQDRRVNPPSLHDAARQAQA